MLVLVCVSFLVFCASHYVNVPCVVVTLLLPHVVVVVVVVVWMLILFVVVCVFSDDIIFVLAFSRCQVLPCVGYLLLFHDAAVLCGLIRLVLDYFFPSHGTLYPHVCSLIPVCTAVRTHRGAEARDP